MKKILITGSTDGIGKLAAIKLAQAGHEIYLHGRNSNKLEAVIAEVKTASSYDKVKGFVADFAELKAVEEMAEQVRNELSALDVLINNAGVFKSAAATNEAGYDLRYVVNYFAPFVLTQELLPLLRKANAPRLINLSSAAQAPISYPILKGEQEGATRATYAQSKLAITMWSFQLAKVEPDITVIPVNPGSLLNTKMVQEAFGNYWSSADKGADILYDLAIEEQYQANSGQYFDNDAGGFGKAHAMAYQQEEIRKLMEATHQVIG
ncbi:MAG: SDR family NAD(P)-dependent oxidoreductase [Saprospiraceae bacterium]|nr:SDR family NAD(P)-dependent oxidoreductase [Saprospiraceae bacterium]